MLIEYLRQCHLTCGRATVKLSGLNAYLVQAVRIEMCIVTRRSSPPQGYRGHGIAGREVQVLLIIDLRLFPSDIRFAIEKIELEAPSIWLI